MVGREGWIVEAVFGGEGSAEEGTGTGKAESMGSGRCRRGEGSVRGEGIGDDFTPFINCSISWNKSGTEGKSEMRLGVGGKNAWGTVAAAGSLGTTSTETLGGGKSASGGRTCSLESRCKSMLSRNTGTVVTPDGYGEAKKK